MERVKEVELKKYKDKVLKELIRATYAATQGLAKLDRWGVANFQDKFHEIGASNPGKELVLLCFEDLCRRPSRRLVPQSDVLHVVQEADGGGHQ
jgi:hypothetical protein